MKRYLTLFLLLLCFVFLFSACGVPNADSPTTVPDQYIASVNEVPAFDGETAFVTIKGNVPDFSEQELVTESYEIYGELDALGRCTTVIACVGRDIMPTEDRGNIGQVKPTGWHTVKYDIVDGKFLYNRCHLIGYQLTGENANRQNLITGTRYLNVEGMLPFENMIADYIKETGNHVLYRVTPIFDGENLLARGVQMEAKSVEDDGKGILFNVYAYNAQPGVAINYATGESALGTVTPGTPEIKYVLNISSKKIHLPTCSSVADINPENKEITEKSKETLLTEGYSLCKVCDP